MNTIVRRSARNRPPLSTKEDNTLRSHFFGATTQTGIAGVFWFTFAGTINNGMTKSPQAKEMTNRRSKQIVNQRPQQMLLREQRVVTRDEK